MDPALHKAVTQGNLNLLKLLITADPKTLLSLTPQQNSALHIASRIGNHEIANQILKECETMLVEKNKDGDTPLHLAAKMGNLGVLDLLIGYCVEWPIDVESDEEAPLKIVNNLGNTALHEAVTHNKPEAALKLLAADPDLGHKLNEKRESPLHIACREGMSEVVREILKHPWVPVQEETVPANSGTGSPLHQAILGGHIKIVAMLLYHRGDLVRQIDSSGNNALHYAAQKDNAKMIEMLLSKDLSLAYLKNYEGQPPLHVAVSYGATSSIEAILKHCPDTAEQVTPNGGNGLHVAIYSGKLSSLKCLLKHIHPEEIINHQDYDGNTALHLATLRSRIHSSLLLIRDKRVDLCKLNNRGQTARSAIETMEVSTYDMFVWRELRKREEKRCKKQQLPPVVTSRAFIRKQPNSTDDSFENGPNMMDQLQIIGLGAVLITTVAFAAAFTLPGGYASNGSPMLAGKYMFRAFILAITSAFIQSFFCMIMLMVGGLYSTDLACKTTFLSISMYFFSGGARSMVLSFGLGLYLVMDPINKGISITILVLVIASVMMDITPHFLEYIILIINNIASSRAYSDEKNHFLSVFRFLLPFLFIFILALIP